MTSLSRIYKSYTTLENVVTLTDDEEFEMTSEEESLTEEIVEDKEELASFKQEKVDEVAREKADIQKMRSEAEALLHSARSMVEDAKLEASKIIAEAEAEGKRRKDELIIQGNKELGMIQQEGYQAGFEAKEKEVNAMLANMNEILSKALEELQVADKQYLNDVESNVRELVMQVTEKILHQKIVEDPLSLSCLIFEMLDSIKKSRFVNVVVSNQAKELIDLVEKEFKENEKYRGEYSVEAKDLPVDNVLIEHDSGVLDASVSSQIAKLREFFEGN